MKTIYRLQYAFTDLSQNCFFFSFTITTDAGPLLTPNDCLQKMGQGGRKKHGGFSDEHENIICNDRSNNFFEI